MIDCYKILGIRQEASLAEIKKAYREKVKRFHPDVTGRTSDSEKFSLIVRAYRILSDERSRTLFEDSFFRRGRRYEDFESFDYYKWLKDRSDEESRAKLIIFTLMNQKEDEAVAEFKRMQMSHTGFSLKKWFPANDFMDFGYILAEELVSRNEFYDAFLLLEQIIQLENERHYFYLFAPEVMEFTLSLLKKNIDGVISDELALDVYERALELGFGDKNDLFFLKKMSDEYERLGDSRTASIIRSQVRLS